MQSILARNLTMQAQQQQQSENANVVKAKSQAAKNVASAQMIGVESNIMEEQHMMEKLGEPLLEGGGPNG